jgi:hypothetical protein
MRVVLTFTAFLLAGATRADDAAFFESKIRPILADHCLRCHGKGPKEPKGGLRLDSRAALLSGGDSGPAIVPGDPAKSRLIEAVKYGNTDLLMPPTGKLPDAMIRDLETWIQAGAVWPGAEVESAAKKSFDLTSRRREQWCWQPLKPIEVPDGQGSAIDPLLQARRNGQPVNPPADPLALLRRVSYDLTGLPPSLADQREITRDPQRYPALVDRYLDSNAFAERWARHWLDLVRYADSKGHEFDHPIPNAWRYRDYVIRAIAADLPYRQFVREHLAGDRITPPRRHADGSNESIQGTGFWLLGEEIHSPVDIRLDQADRLDNRIDVFGKAFLGLTIACARCHDHKFDAVSTGDYYSLFTLLESGAARLARIDDPDQPRAVGPWETDGDAYRFEDGVAVYRRSHDAVNERDSSREPGATNKYQRSGRILRTPVERITNGRYHLLVSGSVFVYAAVAQHQLVSGPLHGRLVRTLNAKSNEWRWETIDLSAYQGLPVHFELSPVPGQDFALAALTSGDRPPERAMPPPPKPLDEPAVTKSSRLALSLWDAPRLPGHVFVRGSHKTPGEVVHARNLLALGGTPLPEGRLSLADQLTDPAISPLTYRVFANRLWKHLFGVGLVPSTDNFGVLGEAPTHPELLDYLARRVIDSTPKRVIREIVMSQAYRMSSTITPDLAASDPSNRTYRRQNLKRLEAEAIRDAILSCSGQLDPTPFGPPVPAHINAYQDGRGKPESGPLDGRGRRSIYLRISRNFLSPFALAFDAPIPFSTVGKRTTSNVPTQALILLNDPFVTEQAQRWGRTLGTMSQPIDDRIDLMHRTALGRPATAAELTACRAFLGDSPDWAALAHVLFNVKEFAFVP